MEITSIDRKKEAPRHRRLIIAEPEDLEVIENHGVPGSALNLVGSGKAYAVMEYLGDEDYRVTITRKEDQKIIFYEDYRIGREDDKKWGQLIRKIYKIN